jgi:hypothetical protein
MAMDTEAPAPVSNKHDIASLNLESTKASTEDEREERPGLNERRMVRSAEHLNLAQEKHVEGETKTSKVRMQHVVKIFQHDADDFIEGTWKRKLFIAFSGLFFVATGSQSLVVLFQCLLNKWHESR